MNRRFHLLLAATACALAVNAQNAAAQTVTVDHARIAENALRGHIQPGYAKLTRALERLETTTQATCKQLTTAEIDVLKAAFTDAILAWGAIAHITFGPIRDSNRYERIFFWLDRKGIARRQVRRALRNTPDAYRSATTLGTRSIGVQGLSAYEQILVTGPFKPEAADFVCAYAAAIAGNLKAIAQTVARAWADDGAFAKSWRSPSADNPVYLKPHETTFALVKAYVENLERVRDVELLRPLGFATRRRKLPGPYARSKQTMPFLAARISGLHDLILKSGVIAVAQKVAVARNDPVSKQRLDQVGFELNFLTQRAQTLAQTPDFFGSEKSREAIALGFPLKAARELARAALADTLELPFGFNSADGD